MNNNDDFYQLIENYHELLTEDQRHQSGDELFCECFCVSYKDITELCPSVENFDGLLIQKKLKVGQGCGQCLKRLEKLTIDLYKSSKEN